MTNFASTGLRAAVFLLMSGSALPALAQAGPTQPPEEATTTGTDAATPAAPADAPPAEAQNSGSGLQEIVVTATKRETNLQKTPIAISVASAQALEDRSVQSLLDLGDGSIPGLRVATFEARQSAVTIGIRGIVPLDANQPAREQGVGVYLDGVYLGRQQGLGAALLDIERIEVLKGPQGTLFGRNTSGGAVSHGDQGPDRPLRPARRRRCRQLQLEERQRPPRPARHRALLVQGRRRRRLSRRDHQEPDARARRDFGYYDRKGMQLKMRFKPSANFAGDFAFDVGKDKNTPFYSQLLNFNPNGYPVATLTGSLPVEPGPPASAAGADRQRPGAGGRRHRRPAARVGRQDPRRVGQPALERRRLARTALDLRLPRRQRRPVGQCRRRPPPAGLLAQRPLQPLLALLPRAEPVQPGIPGGRPPRRPDRLCRRPLLVQGKGVRGSRDAKLAALECRRHCLHRGRRLHRLGRLRLAPGCRSIDRGSRVEFREQGSIRPGDLDPAGVRPASSDRRRPLHQRQEGRRPLPHQQRALALPTDADHRAALHGSISTPTGSIRW